MSGTTTTTPSVTTTTTAPATAGGVVKHWFGQITTGISAIIGAPTLIAALQGQITWKQAAVPLAAAFIAAVWPENPKASVEVTTLANDATPLYHDLEPIIPMLLQAYKTGIQHGSTVPVARAVAAMTATPVAMTVVTPSEKP
jgi:hypothetical protein